MIPHFYRLSRVPRCLGTRRASRILLHLGLLTTILLLAGCSTGCWHADKPPELGYSIDPGLQPEPALLGERPLAAVRDAEGRTSLFIANEVLLMPRDDAELESFLARYGGSVVADDAVPEPPAGSGIILDPSYLEPTQHTVRLDPSAFPLDDFSADATRAGFGGEVTISSDTAARLLALVTQAKAEGLGISPNFVGEGGEGGEILLDTEEHPNGTSFENAFAWSRFQTTGSKAGVTRAWQLVAARELPHDRRLAVIDGGFWLDPTGRPLSSGTGSDLPFRPSQYDFVADDRVAAGMNPARCTGGSACPWHGNGSASVATAALDNQYGAAGTGGLVADPMLFLTDLSWGQVAGAIRCAEAWGADVISMSFGAECDNVFCDLFFELHLYPALRHARNSGVVLVAGAGNEAQSTNMVPCKGNSVICVGALDDDTNTAIGYSNFGPHVDIWAPTNIPAMPDGGSGSGRTVHRGTSAAAPFVAGVAVMMRACDPTLTSDDVNGILRQTAWTDSPDPKVTHYINAFRAVAEVCGSSPPILQVSPESAPSVAVNRDLSVTAVVFDSDDGFPCTACPVTWDPGPQAIRASTATYRFAEPGSTTIVVSTTDSDGEADRVEVPVTVVNTAPAAFIAEPTPGLVVNRGEPTTLRGFGLDPNEGPGPELGRLESGCRWTSSVRGDPFPVADCTAAATFSSNGARTLGLRVEDSLGTVSRLAQVTVFVRDPPADRGPTASFTLPEPNYLDHYGSDLPMSLTGAAADDPDRPYTWEWTATSFDFGSTTEVAAGPVPIGTTRELTWVPQSTPGLIRTGNVRCIPQGQWVRVTLRATDARGNPGPATSRLIHVSCRLI